MTESQIVNRWMSQARLEESRDFLIRALQRRFGGTLPGEVLETINTQPSAPLLKDWFDAVFSANTLQDFIAVLRR